MISSIRQRQSILSLDHATVELAAPAGSLLPGRTTHVYAQVEGRVIYLNSGAPRLARLVQEWVGATPVEDYRLQGGTLSVSRVEDRDGSLLTWTGSHHSLTLLLEATALQEARALMAMFDYTDYPTGLGIAPRPATPIQMPMDEYLPAVYQPTPLGMLDAFPLTRRALDQLPSWEGLSVEGGHLYVEERERSDETTLLLISTTALGRFYPLPDVDIGSAADFMADIEVHWRY